MNVVTKKFPRVVPNAFEAVEASLPGAPRVQDARRGAYAYFQAVGLPTRRVEDFKYTDLRALIGDVAPLAASPGEEALRFARYVVAKREGGSDARTLVLVDGVLCIELSDLAGLEPGLTVRPLRAALAADDDGAAALFAVEPQDALGAFNTAMASDGVLLQVAPNATLLRPIELLHIATREGEAAVTRSLVSIGAGVSATMVESYVSAGAAAAYQTFDGTSIEVADGGRLEHVRLVEDGDRAANLSVATVKVGASASYNLFTLASGGQVNRYQSTIVCAGEGSHVSTNGVAMLKDRQHADTTIVLDHAVPNCASRETFRAVLDDRARAVFQGRIVVRPQAQKTDAKMMTRALLLSDEAEADNKPELEIFADDVTCGHGATTGALDESLLFYLRARGLNEKQAEALLIQAFVGEAIEAIADQRLREQVIAAAERWLAARG